MEFLFESHRSYRDDSSRSRPGDGPGVAGSDGTATGGASSVQGEAEDDGGWSSAVLGEGLRGDPTRCDILEVRGGLNNQD